MRLVVGLGNPGDKYARTRHNVGFILVDELAVTWGLTWECAAKLSAASARCTEHAVLLLKPQTFMNDSGKAVAKAVAVFGIQPADLLVVHDDVDLAPLRFKVSRNVSSAGHRGVQSIITALGTQDFTRLRVGVGRPKLWHSADKYVLQDLPADQLALLKKQGIEQLLSSLGV